MQVKTQIRKSVRRPSMSHLQKPDPVSTTIGSSSPQNQQAPKVGAVIAANSSNQKKSASVHNKKNSFTISVPSPKKQPVNNFVSHKDPKAPGLLVGLQSYARKSKQIDSSKPKQGAASKFAAPQNRNSPKNIPFAQGGRLHNQIKVMIDSDKNDSHLYQQIHKIPLYVTFNQNSNKIEGETRSKIREAEVAFSKTEYKGLDRWRIMGLVGAGATSEVYKVYDKKYDRILAGKKMVLLHEDPVVQKAIDNQLKIMTRLEHPHIVQYYETYKEDVDVWIFMEFLPITVEKMYSESDDGHLSETATRVYTKQLVQAVKFLHDNKVIHKDIKCSNLLINSMDAIKLSDFGSSKQFQQSNSQSAQLANGAGTFKGSILWMAPETISKNLCTRKSDIWSLGCTVLEMVTGLKPWYHFEVDNEITAIYKIGTTNQIPLIPDRLSQPLKQFLLMCLVRDPEARATAQDLLKSAYLQ